MITFRDTFIPGLVGPILPSSPELDSVLTKVMGLRGVSEINSLPGQSMIEVEVYLFAGYTKGEQIEAALASLNDHIGDNGTLIVGGLIPVTHDNCTFIGWEPLPFFGNSYILKDVAGTLKGEDGRADGGWFAHIKMKWRKLGWVK